MSEDLISSLYPPPPPYYKYFTDENLEKLRKAKENEENRENEEHQLEKAENPQSGDTDAATEVQLPPELKLLTPPTQPVGDHYRGYGNLWSFENKLPSLKDSGWRQLYEDEDENITSKTKTKELHKLTDSLLLNFLELVGSVAVDPSQFHVKIEDLKLILININHILNTYRPHQTRESLIMLLRKHIDSKRAEIAEIDRVSENVKLKILSLVTEQEPIHEEEEETLASGDDTNDREKLHDAIAGRLLETV